MQVSALLVVHYLDTAPAFKTVLLMFLKVRLGDKWCDLCIPFSFHLQDLLNLSHILLSVSSSNKELQPFKSLSVKQCFTVLILAVVLLRTFSNCIHSS